MPRLMPRLMPKLILAAALPLALAACHKADDGTAGSATGGTPVAAVAPPAGKAWSDVVAKTADNGMLMGNPNAPIKLAEYGSLSCPHCAHLAEEMMPGLVSKYVNTGKVSYEYRSFAIHGIDIPLTVLVRCADPSAFFGLIEQLYTNQVAMLTRAQKGQAEAEASSKLPAAQRIAAVADAYGLPEFFSARGLPLNAAHACLANTAMAEAVAKEADAIGAKGIDSTPTLMINGTKNSAASWHELEAALQAAGAR